VPISWPGGGPWVLATTSAALDWQLPAAALAAASTVRVAALVLGGRQPPHELLLAGLASYLEAGEGAADPLTLDEAAALVRTLARTHGLVLVVGVPGLLVPVGRAGWTLTDLAAAVSAPVVVVTDEGPDSVNHTTLALGALTGRGLAAAVVTVTVTAEPVAEPVPEPVAEPVPEPVAEPVPEPVAEPGEPVAEPGAPEEGTGDDGSGGLPVAPAGRIPADAAERPDEFAAAARRWLNPILHASAGRPKAETPAPRPSERGPTTSGKRAVLLLVGVFVSLTLVVCGVAFCGRTVTTHSVVRIEATGHARSEILRPQIQPVPAATRVASAVCPEHRGRIAPTTPSRAAVKRVDAAWKRIEDWLAVAAPRSRRSLRPPATAEAIAELQKRMSVSFPPDLVASLLRHDGVTAGGFPLPFFYQPLPVDRIAGDWLSTCTALADVFPAGDSGWWDRAFVPFAASSDGGCLLVDARVGSHGRIGEFFDEEGVDFTMWPASLAELLEKTAQSLETGRPYENRYRPKVSPAGTVEWDVL
jgi:cell wall assembly regulator SMI1